MICGSKNCAFSIDGLFALYDLHFARLIESESRRFLLKKKFFQVPVYANLEARVFFSF